MVTVELSALPSRISVGVAQTFRNLVVAHSDDCDHSFRSIATTCSDRSRPPIPIDRDHLFRSIATRLWAGVTSAVG